MLLAAVKFKHTFSAIGYSKRPSLSTKCPSLAYRFLQELRKFTGVNGTLTSVSWDL